MCYNKLVLNVLALKVTLCYNIFNSEYAVDLP